jgi:predicted kinase
MQVVHAICPACALPTVGAEVSPEDRLFICDLCGTSTAFNPLPPLLFLTGASGAGKTTLSRSLVGTVREAVLVDQDLLWNLDPSHDDPGSNYRRFRGLVLHMAHQIARNGVSVMVEGTCTPEQYESLGERWYFSKTAYLAVVCDDEDLRRRLEARPPWRRSSRLIDPMLAMNQWFKDNASSLNPAVRLLDTTKRPVSECADEVHGWIRGLVASESSPES